MALLENQLLFVDFQSFKKTTLLLLIWNRKMSHFAKYLCTITLERPLKIVFYFSWKSTSRSFPVWTLWHFGKVIAQFLRENCLIQHYWRYLRRGKKGLTKNNNNHSKLAIICEIMFIYKTIPLLLIWNGKRNHFTKCLCSMTINTFLSFLLLLKNWKNELPHLCVCVCVWTTICSCLFTWNINKLKAEIVLVCHQLCVRIEV